MLIVIYLLIRVYKAKKGTQIGISDDDPLEMDIQQHHSINSIGNNNNNKSEKKKTIKKIKSIATQSNQQGLLNDDDNNDHPIVV